MHIPPEQPLACVEIGGGSIQTALFENGTTPKLVDGAHQPDGFALAFAVPGIIAGGVVQEASNLGWRDIDPVAALALAGPAHVVLNDAEAAALGEADLRGEDGLRRLVYICVGTGIGGAVVVNGEVVRANLFGHNAPPHGHAFGELPCRCERRGCLETVAAGWALPDPLTGETIADLGSNLARAIELNELSRRGTVVIGGGIAKRYPDVLAVVAERLPGQRVEPSLAPDDAKSAAPWGLRYSLKGTGR